MKIKALGLGLGCALILTPVFSGSVFAKNWWDTAKDVLNSDTAGKVIDTIDKSTNETKSGKNGASTLSSIEISKGLREALRVGTQRVVGQLGTEDGFNLDPNIHIPLPSTLKRVDNALASLGMGALTEELELRLNRAAEAATPKAKALFVQAISEMTITDAKDILTGPDNAATQYLRRTMGSELTKEMQPLIETALAGAGAIKMYDQVMGQYKKIPFMPDAKANLRSYVSEKAMDGIFYYVAKEEAAIRNNPAQRTTDILKKVFAY